MGDVNGGLMGGSRLSVWVGRLWMFDWFEVELMDPRSFFIVLNGVANLCWMGNDHDDLSKLSDKVNWGQPMWRSGMFLLLHALLSLIYVFFHLFFQLVASRDGTQTRRNHADHHGWKPGPAVQRHPERRSYWQGVLQSSGGAIHQRWAVRCFCLFTLASCSKASCFWGSALLLRFSPLTKKLH